MYYLLGLWSRLVSSVPYLKSDAPSLLDSFVPQITEAYVNSRLDSVQVWQRVQLRSVGQRTGGILALTEPWGNLWCRNSFEASSDKEDMSERGVIIRVVARIKTR